MFIFIFANWNLPWAHKTTTYQKPFDHQRLQRWMIVCSVIADFELRILYMPGLYFIAKLTLSVYHIIRFWFFAFVITLVFWLALTANDPSFETMMTSINSKNLSLPWLMECERVNYFCKRQFGVMVKSTLMNFNLKCMQIIIHA